MTAKAAVKKSRIPAGSHGRESQVPAGRDGRRQDEQRDQQPVASGRRTRSLVDPGAGPYRHLIRAASPPAGTPSGLVRNASRQLQRWRDQPSSRSQRLLISGQPPTRPAAPAHAPERSFQVWQEPAQSGGGGGVDEPFHPTVRQLIPLERAGAARAAIRGWGRSDGGPTTGDGVPPRAGLGDPAGDPCRGLGRSRRRGSCRPRMSAQVVRGRLVGSRLVEPAPPGG
jgi:hypothetical protein